MDDLEPCLYDLESFQTILKVSGRSKKCPDHPENVAGFSKIQNHILCAFVTDLKIDAIYTLYPESFCDKDLAIRKVFAFSASGEDIPKKTAVLLDFVIRVAIVLEIRIFIRVLIFVLDLVLGLLIQVQELQPINFFFLLFFFHGAAAAKYQLKDNKHTTDFTQDLGT